MAGEEKEETLQKTDQIKTYDKLDRIGMSASAACALHCALMPLAVALIPFSGIKLIAGEYAEWTVIGFSIAIGITSLLLGYARQHRRASALIVFATGLMFILIARTVLAESELVEAPMVVIGSLTVAASHVVNRRLCRNCLVC